MRTALLALLLLCAGCDHRPIHGVVTGKYIQPSRTDLIHMPDGNGGTMLIPIYHPEIYILEVDTFHDVISVSVDSATFASVEVGKRIDTK